MQYYFRSGSFLHYLHTYIYGPNCENDDPGQIILFMITIKIFIILSKIYCTIIISKYKSDVTGWTQV